ncbi:MULTISPECIES: molybdopterin-dependent oxidoreductase [Alkalimonas]|uniref:Molybdopterin-dependent oxidoreductase n=1 Tax=Alkalimonas mucilaginosa TaxID=3057676 RepID=A0ABU7JIH1_9GAMM|nr:molybdopterin-dependent oxidoreductase [Alkalimonas sp. MEB004]MEE2025477.1 molybdopterin-dependent oxidoreductase [Alkalimonas sp. MEB004]
MVHLTEFRWLCCLLLFITTTLVADEVTQSPVLLIRSAELEQKLWLHDLDNLPQQQARFQAAWGPDGLWQGVYLHDLLAHFQLDGHQDIRLNALNDYRIRITQNDIAKGQPVLATRFNGEPIPLERNGPVILIWPEQAQQALDGTSPLALWIWSLAEIRVLR